MKATIPARMAKLGVAELSEVGLVQLNNVASEFAKLVHRLAGAPVELELRCAPDLALVTLELGKVRQIVVNLAASICELIEHGGKIIVETANLAGEGPGPEGVVPRSYVMLAITYADGRTPVELLPPKLPALPAPDRPSLATLCGLIRRQGGKFSVRCHAPGGVTFQVCLPRATVGTANATARDEAPRSPQGNETILLVDEDELVRCAMAHALRGAGYTVLEAAEEVSALCIEGTYPGPIHLVIAGHGENLPGPKLARRLDFRRQGLRLLCIADEISTLPRPPEAFAYTRYLAGPVSQRALLRGVREVLDFMPPAEC